MRPRRNPQCTESRAQVCVLILTEKSPLCSEPQAQHGRRDSNFASRPESEGDSVVNESEVTETNVDESGVADDCASEQCMAVTARCWNAAARGTPKVLGHEDAASDRQGGADVARDCPCQRANRRPETSFHTSTKIQSRISIQHCPF